MIAIEKDFEANPIKLHKPRLNAFEQNKAAGKYCSSDLYKPLKVKVALDALYHKKCAYCEKSLKDADRHIEHYRPKNPYYWLAFSWDNLLIACDKCNKLKSNKFTAYLEGEQLKYNNETLKTAQSNIKAYNLIEKPLIINPEQETTASLKLHFTFDLNTAEIVALSPQMEATIKVCQLNREELIERRREILDDFKNAINRRELKIRDKIAFVKSVLDLVTDLKHKIQPEASYTAWLRFIKDNWRNIIK